MEHVRSRSGKPTDRRVAISDNPRGRLEVQAQPPGLAEAGSAPRDTPSSREGQISGALCIGKPEGKFAGHRLVAEEIVLGHLSFISADACQNAVGHN
jgi:hypothetical protein